MSGRIHIDDAVNWASPLNRGLVSWWVALPDHQRGNVFRDLCGRNHGALVNGGTWHGPRGEPGIYGSLLGDNTDSYIDAGAITIGTGDETWIASVYVTTTATADKRGIFSCMGVSPGMLFAYREVSSTANKLYVEAYDGTNNPNGHSTGVLTVNTWNRVGLKRAGGTFTFYVEGVPSGTVADSTVSISPATNLFLLGRGQDNTANYFPGYGDNFKRFTRGLSDSEMLIEHAESLAGSPTTLNWHRPYRAFEQAGGAPAGTILHVMNQMYAGAA